VHAERCLLLLIRSGRAARLCKRVGRAARPRFRFPVPAARSPRAVAHRDRSGLAGRRQSARFPRLNREVEGGVWLPTGTRAQPADSARSPTNTGSLGRRLRSGAEPRLVSRCSRWSDGAGQDGDGRRERGRFDQAARHRRRLSTQRARVAHQHREQRSLNIPAL
jgi:hypothetical protein